MGDYWITFGSQSGLFLNKFEQFKIEDYHDASECSAIKNVKVAENRVAFF